MHFRIIKKIIIFSIIGLFALSCGNPDLRSEKRVITVAAFGDEEFRKYEEWESLIRRNLNEVSKVYDSLFGIQFQLSSLNEWESDDDAYDFTDLFYNLEEYSKPCTTDIVVGFSLQAPTKTEKLNKADFEWGLSSSFGSVVVVRFGLSEILDDEQVKITLIHEIAHLFGAWHCSDSTTIMGVTFSRYKPRIVFDNQAARVLGLLKNFNFCEGILGLDTSIIQQVSRIFREDHLSEQQNPIAGKFDSKAQEYIKRGHLDSASTMFNYALPHYDTSTCTHLSQMSMALGSMNRLDSAIIVGNKAIMKDPTQKEARNSLAVLYLASGQSLEALVHLDIARSIDPEYEYALLNLAKAHLQLNDTARAVEMIDSLLLINPDHTSGRMLLDSLQSF